MSNDSQNKCRFHAVKCQRALVPMLIVLTPPKISHNVRLFPTFILDTSKSSYTYSKMSLLVSQTLIFLLHYGTNRLTAAPVVVDDWLFAAACRKCSTVASAAVGCCWDTKSGNLAQQPGYRPETATIKTPQQVETPWQQNRCKGSDKAMSLSLVTSFLVEFPMSCKAIGCGETTRTKCKSWQDTMCLIKLSFQKPLS